MKEDLIRRLGECSTLPSPPGIVVSLLKLTEDPEVDTQRIADLIEKDPSLTAQVLRIVNSPLFGLRRDVTSLRQAAAFLGISGITTVAMGFSLSGGLLRRSWRDTHGELLWKRSVLSAGIARELAEVVQPVRKEEVFLGALLQDIGILALRQLLGQEYEDLLDENLGDHCALIEAEMESFGGNHTEVGAWLLRHWGLPELFSQMIMSSHQGTLNGERPELKDLFGCVFASSQLAQAWLSSESAEKASEVIDQGSLTLTREQLEQMLGRVIENLPELVRVFQAGFSAQDMDGLLNRARQISFNRSLQYMFETRGTEAAVVSLSAEVVQLREDSRRDPLTGLYNRQFFEDVLQESFARTLQTGLPLSICFCDVDNFKLVNDRCGHLEGDRVLRRFGEIVVAEIRKGDFVCRFGGDEFVILLVGCPAERTAVVCDRIRTRLSEEPFPYSGGAVTVSLGYAVQTGSSPFASAEDLVRAADQATYCAKLKGRNKVVGHLS